GFVERAVAKYGDAISVGADIKDGIVAIKGWTEKSALTCDAFCQRMQQIGVKTMIVTDISRDGAMQGTNRALYAELSAKYAIDFIASGGVSSMGDIIALRAQNLYGAIIGKAYYTGAIDLAQAIKEAAL
ncbi:MAG: 1-(5-phosphoribosyl)-5-((5-phosphoribosylamino)methylideneamino)imidazole-4-carboxamide isomerase, partial [Clostridia bacterium]|nr:1-(5-phosphoribosyl)-5-((5-phosphoribosylamino)methylideneamino)imidazole-4-carboxamide isomerase [Clostridia bacterium]